jgi:hypothetical protein
VILYGSYKTGEANDGEVYLAQITRVFSEYPVDVMREVAVKLPDRIKWLPTISEIRDACNEVYAPMRYAMQWEAGAKRQLAERETLALTDGRPRKTYEQIRAEFAEVGIHFDKRSKPIDVAAIRQKHGISQEQWDAIPNAKMEGA